MLKPSISLGVQLFRAPAASFLHIGLRVLLIDVSSGFVSMSEEQLFGHDHADHAY